MDKNNLLDRITFNPQIFGGKPIIRGRRLAVEHVGGMLAAGDSPETVLEGYPWLEPDDIRACLAHQPVEKGDSPSQALRILRPSRTFPKGLSPFSTGC